MGTSIQAYALDESDFRGDRFSRSLDEPQGKQRSAVADPSRPGREIHASFLDAGADLISTNTFNATTISQADYSTQHLAREINLESARIARAAADAATKANPANRGLWSACSGRPTEPPASRPTSMTPPFVTSRSTQLRGAYSDALIGLVEGDVDVVMIETIFDTLNAKAAIYAILEYRDDHPDSICRS